MKETEIKAISERLTRLAEAVEKLAPAPAPPLDLSSADAFVWHAETQFLEPIAEPSRIPLELLYGIDRIRDLLLDNTRRFADHLPANNALLWGARGTGKSSLIKALHASINHARKIPIALVEIHREDLSSLPALMKILRGSGRRFILFCDDLSFSSDDTTYKSLKAALDGGIEGRPDNVVFYATSNRRHLMPRDMMENERSTAINPSEAVEEKVSLSDRFGLWLGFHNCSQEDYFAMIDGYIRHYGITINPEDWQAQARVWSVTRGARSGRVAWQFIVDLAGRQGQTLE